MSQRGIAIVNANVARALIRAQGMVTENKHREALDRPVAYYESDFEKLIVDEGIDHNYVVTLVNEVD